MPHSRRRYPAELKGKVALEALREEATMTDWPLAMMSTPQPREDAA